MAKPTENKTAAYTTKKPTGITITRSGMNFTVEWKKADDNYSKGIQLQYRINGKGNWTAVTVAASSTKKSFSLNANSFFPITIKEVNYIAVRLRGKRADFSKTVETEKKITVTAYSAAWSAWAEKDYLVSAPPTPSLTAALDSQLANKTSFSWNLTVDSTNARPFARVQWQTILVQNCTETNGEKLKWKESQTGWGTDTSSSVSSSVNKTEDSDLLAGKSFTRWVRIRAQGIGGDSDWRYAKHVYAKPKAAVISKVDAKEKASGGMLCTVTWTADANAALPIDSATAQYCIVTPDAGLACPSGASWTDAVTIADTAGKDAARFETPSAPGLDQCLFIRVNTVHDANITYGNPFLAAKGTLTNPGTVSVSANANTHIATITAANNSTVPDSFLAIYYKTSKAPKKKGPIGIIAHGYSSATIQCPAWTGQIKFGVRAIVGSYTAKTGTNGVTNYSITEKMASLKTEWGGGTVPEAPGNVTAKALDDAGTVEVAWDWKWNEADISEISWADHEDAWESTSGPSTYQVTNLNASVWHITGLETGKTWYIKVRLIKSLENNAFTYGDYSDAVAVDLSTAPERPVLYLSQSSVTANGKVKAYWAYSSADNAQQAYAEVCVATVSAGGISYGRIIARTNTAQYVTISAKKAGWTAGNTYALCVRTVSAAGRASDGWSDPAYIAVADAPSCQITSTSLENVTIQDDNGTSRTVLALTQMPMSVSVSGAIASHTTTVIIERAEDYRVDRPDEAFLDGYEGETVAVSSMTGAGTFSITLDDLTGRLDEGAKYRILAYVKNEFGETAEAAVGFEVRWNTKAVPATAVVEIDASKYAAYITPAIGSGGQAQNLTCDIYRLSADRPELIVEGAEWGLKYVDPYPALGEKGGHRIVCRTMYGDYITSDGSLAWTDYGAAEGDTLDDPVTIIDFGGSRVRLAYNLSISSKWEKDFTETRYLGGAVRGDWNRAVGRKGTISASAVSFTDSDTIDAMRRLAVYAGICHVRTPDGSSFAADVQVSEERSCENGGKTADFSISVSRVDPEGLEGELYSNWHTS